MYSAFCNMVILLLEKPSKGSLEQSALMSVISTTQNGVNTIDSPSFVHSNELIKSTLKNVWIYALGNWIIFKPA